MNHNEKIVRSLKFVVDKYLDDKVKDSKLKVSVSKISEIAKKSVVISHIVNFNSMDFLKQCFCLFLVYEGESITNAVDKVFNKEILRKLSFESADDIRTEKVCESCDEGKVDCWDCSGDGDISCGTCDGERSYTCDDCEGDGEFEDGESCNTCDGTGEISCEDCEGDGRVECHSCYGDGTWDCADCDGEGTTEFEPDEFQVEVELNTFLVLNNRFDDFMVKYDEYDDNDELKIDFSNEIMKKIEKESDSIMPYSKSFYDEDIDEWNDQSELIATYIGELKIKNKLLSYSRV